MATRTRAAARRLDGLESSVIRDILRLTRGGDVLSLAGGLPAPESFPVADVALAVTDLAPAELVWLSVPVDADGLDVDRLFQADAPRLAYTVTEASNPSGATMSFERREEVGLWADRTGCVVVEDRAYDGLEFDRGPVAPSIGSWTDRVLTTGTVSKTLAPGLRVGWVAGPPDLLDPLWRAKQAADLQTGTLAQYVVGRLVADPAWPSFPASHSRRPRAPWIGCATASACRSRPWRRSSSTRPLGGWPAPCRRELRARREAVRPSAWPARGAGRG